MKSMWDKHKWPISIIGAILLLVLFFWLLPLFLNFLYEYVFCKEINNNFTVLGTIGDSYGVYNALFSLFAFIGLIYTLQSQYNENKKNHVVEQYYKMLDYQRELISDMVAFPVIKDKNAKPVQGRKVFVEYKIQLKYLNRAIQKINQKEDFGFTETEVADISYAIFYYGSAGSWKSTMMKHLREYENCDKLVDAIVDALDKEKRYALYRTNQNYMSVYCRNMYNAIKLIDNADCLSDEEKQSYVKTLRAQLCNAELYVLFFNFISRFGRKWVESDYVNKYQLLQNIPAGYCDGYDPKDYFPNIKFESEESVLSPFKNIVVPN